jgi:hypothetical protein
MYLLLSVRSDAGANRRVPRRCVRPHLLVSSSMAHGDSGRNVASWLVAPLSAALGYGQTWRRALLYCVSPKLGVTATPPRQPAQPLGRGMNLPSLTDMSSARCIRRPYKLERLLAESCSVAAAGDPAVRYALTQPKRWLADNVRFSRSENCGPLPGRSSPSNTRINSS